ncbi:hypothetical protein HanXRQr2_Chr03g0104241 [Helianthus annuus]|uniref:Uncharacterized protein n=1 Tax=Helianthus annuus TaxID=4232 RepID=A0A251V550_HELAN|nr:hypothetical protein HanXRQr2_Chr03g0104241 [Helianthus annuus]KAJ0943157.1 hypothetical protein HanPSC8_Chr03g0100731 [Helianthus annuus]
MITRVEKMERIFVACLIYILFCLHLVNFTFRTSQATLCRKILANPQHDNGDDHGPGH